MAQLRKKQKIRMFRKLTPFVGQKIKRMVNDEMWTKTEIAQETGVEIARLTRMCYPEKYKTAISENDFIRLIGGGIVAIDELIEKAGEELNADEKAFLQSMKIHEDERMKTAYQLARAMDLDPAQIILNYIRDIKN